MKSAEVVTDSEPELGYRGVEIEEEHVSHHLALRLDYPVSASLVGARTVFKQAALIVLAAVKKGTRLSAHSVEKFVYSFFVSRTSLAKRKTFEYVFLIHSRYP